MPLVNPLPVLEKAREKGFCVGAFNAVDFLSMEAIVEAAEAKRSPVIIQASSGAVKRFGIERLVSMAKTAAKDATVPVSLHLDHGTKPDMIKEAIRMGFTSVMIDASKLPLEQNIAVSADIVAEARRHGVSVEGEIGVVAGVEDDIVVNASDAIYTSPEEAMDYQGRSGVDFLAAAIGTAHGFYKVAPKLDIGTLRALRQKTSFPLVVHGGTGLSNDTIAELVRAGAAKFNVSTQVKQTYVDSLYEYIQANREEYDILKVLDTARRALTGMIEDYLDILGSSGKA